MSEWIWLIPIFFWSVMLLLPWQSWRNREALQVTSPVANSDLSDITVVIPARNEALQIGQTLRALERQGHHLQVIVVDDQSQDDTLEVLRRSQGKNMELTVVQGEELSAGWSGKLWALQQGHALVKRPITVLLDADITLAPGVLAGLREKMQEENIALISLMAHLSMTTFWEKLLLPAFVYFFKQLYPFALSNNPRVKYVAAAAGGCIMVKSAVLNSIGGFTSIRKSLIDDCALARIVKQNGFTTWLGLTRDVQSHRAYGGLKPIWQMVSRTAFHQLKYSLSLLLFMTAIFFAIYALPWLGLFHGELLVKTVSAMAIVIMMGMYIPILRYYKLNPGWCFGLPLIALLFLLMSWYSALEYLFGAGNSWHGRCYSKNSDIEELVG